MAGRQINATQRVSHSVRALISACLAKRRPAVSLALFLTLFGLAFASPSDAFSESLLGKQPGSPYPIIESHYAAEDRVFIRRLPWIDNDRFFFIGEPIAAPLARIAASRKKEPVPARKMHLYIWNTRTNKIEIYERAGEASDFCYNEVEEVIHYRSPNKENVLVEGKLGNEREVHSVPPPKKMQEDRNKRGVFFHELTCREYPYAPKGVGVIQRRVFPLLFDQGILDSGGETADDLRPIKLFSNDYQRVTELPLPRRAIDRDRVYFSKYKNAYILYGSTAPPTYSHVRGTWPDGIDQPIYFLSPTGKLSLGGEIPWRERYREALVVYFTVAGLIYATGSEPDNRGFFLVSSGRIVPIFTYSYPLRTVAAGVSPNGCKLAIGMASDRGTDVPNLKVINFCRAAVQ